MTNAQLCGVVSHRTHVVLTDRDSAMLTLNCRGLSNEQIARVLHLSVSTVRGYMTQLFAGFGVSSRTELAVRAVHLKLVDASVWPPVATTRRCMRIGDVVALFGSDVMTG